MDDNPELSVDLPAGAQRASTELFALVYDQLKSLAQRRMAHEQRGHTLQATALVHETFMRLAKADARFADERQFFWAAAAAMQRILVEHARAKGRIKRGGGARREPLNVLDLASNEDPEEILALDDAIGRLEIQLPQSAAVVRLRFYAGLTVEETARVLDVSARTVNREWTYARAWLFRELHEPR